MSIQKSQKIATKFYCECCDYSTCNLYDFNKHNNTIKHFSNDKSIISTDLSQKSQEKKFICVNCNKSYKDNSGLWKHKKKCCNKLNNELSNEELNNQITPELIMSVLQQNKELQQILLEQNKTIIELSTNNIITNNNITNTN